MTERQLKAIWARTAGHCHFCGDPVDFEKRGWAPQLDGYWEVDHVIQRGKGGQKGAENCLPACTRCNRLRWHRTGAAVRELLELGLIARDEIRRESEAGVILAKMRHRRISENEGRRRAAR
jgi:5-methylcytosine-specific restriction endonuclease McrA